MFRLEQLSDLLFFQLFCKLLLHHFLQSLARFYHSVCCVHIKLFWNISNPWLDLFTFILFGLCCCNYRIWFWLWLWLMFFFVNHFQRVFVFWLLVQVGVRVFFFLIIFLDQSSCLVLCWLSWTWFLSLLGFNLSLWRNNWWSWLLWLMTNLGFTTCVFGWLSFLLGEDWLSGVRRVLKFQGYHFDVAFLLLR